MTLPLHPDHHAIADDLAEIALAEIRAMAKQATEFINRSAGQSARRLRERGSQWS